MKSPKAWLRAWLGVDECVEAINGMSPIVLSTHKRLRTYEANVPAIQKIARSVREKYNREHPKQPNTRDTLGVRVADNDVSVCVMGIGADSVASASGEVA